MSFRPDWNKRIWWQGFSSCFCLLQKKALTFLDRWKSSWRIPKSNSWELHFDLWCGCVGNLDTSPWCPGNKQKKVPRDEIWQRPFLGWFFLVSEPCFLMQHDTLLKICWEISLSCRKRSPSMIDSKKKRIFPLVSLQPKTAKSMTSNPLKCWDPQTRWSAKDASQPQHDKTWNRWHNDSFCCNKRLTSNIFRLASWNQFSLSQVELLTKCVPTWTVTVLGETPTSQSS